MTRDRSPPLAEPRSWPTRSCSSSWRCRDHDFVPTPFARAATAATVRRPVSDPGEPREPDDRYDRRSTELTGRGGAVRNAPVGTGHAPAATRRRLRLRRHLDHRSEPDPPLRGRMRGLRRRPRSFRPSGRSAVHRRPRPRRSRTRTSRRRRELRRHPRRAGGPRRPRSHRPFRDRAVRLSRDDPGERAREDGWERSRQLGHGDDRSSDRTRSSARRRVDTSVARRPPTPFTTRSCSLVRSRRSVRGTDAGVTPAGRGATGAQSGAYVTFDTTTASTVDDEGRRLVRLRRQRAAEHQRRESRLESGRRCNGRHAGPGTGCSGRSPSAAAR